MARVVVDVPLAHLDRPFDYAVPDGMTGEVRAGCRVRVRFAGQLVDGFVLELTDVSESGRKLAPLAKVVSAEPVLTPEVVTLARAVAERWGGTVTDVLRLAVPPRRAAAEKRPPAEPPPPPAPPDPAGFALYPTGPARSCATWTCCARSTPRPPPTVTSAAPTSSCPGSGWTASRRCARPRGSEEEGPPFPRASHPRRGTLKAGRSSTSPGSG